MSAGSLTLDELRSAVRSLADSLRSTSQSPDFHDDLAVPVHIKHQARGVVELCDAYLARRDTLTLAAKLR
jgi:hypothetical protein